MIFGRPINQIIAAVSAVLNLLVIAAAQAGIVITAELVAALNAAILAVVTLVAGQAPTVAEGTTVNVVTPAGEPNKTVTV